MVKEKQKEESFKESKMRQFMEDYYKNMKVEQGCHLMSPIMTLTKAYSMREKKTKRVHEDMNISIACRKTGFNTINCHKNMTRLNMKGTLNFCFLAFMK